MPDYNTNVAIIGAGPAGLSAAYRLVQAGCDCVVLEKLPQVGGIARTEVYKGYHIDVGGHRFYTKIPEVEQFWHDILGADLLVRPRLSRIYFRGQFFHYPLRIGEVLSRLGLVEGFHIGTSYLRARIAPFPLETTFEHWVVNRFGRRLYETFFKTYTEKVWGIPCNEISAEWASQRIQDLSLLGVLRHALSFGSNTPVKTLISEFYYPRLGPGMLWESVRQQVENNCGRVWCSHTATRVSALTGGQGFEIIGKSATGEETLLRAEHVISSAPLPQLLTMLRPTVPDKLLQKVQRLQYRDLLVVALVVEKPDPFPDTWLYIHSPQVKVGRIQNFRNWSQSMIPDERFTCLGLEYFCQQGDALWQQTDAELIDLASRELSQLNIVRQADVCDGVVLRQPQAYPVYRGKYREILDLAATMLATWPGLQTIGRNGLHRYNNQDHAILTGFRSAENVLGAHHNIWTLNTDRSYYEDMSSDFR